MNTLAKNVLKGVGIGSVIALASVPAGATALVAWTGKGIYNVLNGTDLGWLDIAKNTKSKVTKVQSELGDLFGRGNNNGQNNTITNNPNQSPEIQIEGELTNINQMVNQCKQRSNNSNMRFQRLQYILEVLEKQENKINNGITTTKKTRFGLGKNKTIQSQSLIDRINNLPDGSEKIKLQDKLYTIEDLIQQTKDKLTPPAPTLQLTNTNTLSADYQFIEGQDISLQINTIKTPQGGSLQSVEIQDSNGNIINNTFDNIQKTVTISGGTLPIGTEKYTITYTISDGTNTITSIPKEFSIKIEPRPLDINKLNQETKDLNDVVDNLLDPNITASLNDLSNTKSIVEQRITSLKVYETRLTGAELTLLNNNLSILQNLIPRIDQKIQEIIASNNQSQQINNLPIITSFNNIGSNIVGDEAIISIPSTEIIDNGSVIDFEIIDRDTNLPIPHTIDTTTTGEYRIKFAIPKVGNNKLSIGYTRKDDNISSLKSNFTLKGIDNINTNSNTPSIVNNSITVNINSPITIQVSGFTTPGQQFNIPGHTITSTTFDATTNIYNLTIASSNLPGKEKVEIRSDGNGTNQQIGEVEITIESNGLHAKDLADISNDLSTKFIELPYNDQDIQDITAKISTLKSTIDTNNDQDEKDIIDQQLLSIQTIQSIQNIYIQSQNISKANPQTNTDTERQQIRDNIDQLVNQSNSILTKDQIEQLNQITTICDIDEYFRDKNNLTKDKVVIFIDNNTQQIGNIRNNLQSLIHPYIKKALGFYGTLTLDTGDMNTINAYITFCTQQEHNNTEYTILKDKLTDTKKTINTNKNKPVLDFIDNEIQDYNDQINDISDPMDDEMKGSVQSLIESLNIMKNKIINSEEINENDILILSYKMIILGIDKDSIISCIKDITNNDIILNEGFDIHSQINTQELKSIEEQLKIIHLIKDNALSLGTQTDFGIIHTLREKVSNHEPITEDDQIECNILINKLDITSQDTAKSDTQKDVAKQLATLLQTFMLIIKQ